MHQAKHTKMSLARIKLVMRAFFLSGLLLGNAFIFVSAIASNQVFAKGVAKVSQQHLSGLQPHAVASVNNILHPEKHTDIQKQHGASDHQTVSLQASGKTHVLPAATQGPLQDVNITSNVQGGPTYQVGQTLIFDLSVTNTSPTTALDSTSGVAVYNLIPLGLTNIVTTGSGWIITTTASTGPSVLQANYNGSPVTAGAAFSQIEVSGILTSEAVPAITSTAGVNDNTNPNANLTTFSVNVSPSTQTVTVTSTATIPTVISTPISNVSLSFNVHGGPTYQVGQTLTFDLIVTNTSSTATLDSTSNVGIGNFIPLGISNVVAAGNGWTVTATNANGPFLIGATYTGPPIAPGGTFSPFEISGTLTSNASPAYTNTGGVADAQYPTAAITTFSIGVSSATPTASPTVTVSPSPTVTVLPPPTVTVLPPSTAVISLTPTVTVLPSPTMTVPPTITPPQLAIVSSSPDGNTYTVGQTVHSILTVTNLPASNAESQPITVQDILPVGLNTIVATGSDWNISLSSTTSPTMMMATYVGPYPVAPGTTLPPISVSGVLTPAAGSFFTSGATVSSAGIPNPNPELNTSIQTVLVLAGSVSPTATVTIGGTPTTTVTAGNTPNVSILQTNLGSDHFDVGDKVTYVLIVSNAPADEAVDAPITVSDSMPVGLNSITWDAPGWSISVSDHSSPALMTADYTGSFPIPSGQVLPPITIMGTLNGDAVPSLTTTATVATPGNINLLNSTASDTIFVTEQHNNNNNNHQNNNNNHQNNNNNHQNNNNNHQNNNHQNNNNNNCNCNNHAPGLPGTGSDPLGADVSDKG